MDNFDVEKNCSYTVCSDALGKECEVERIRDHDECIQNFSILKKDSRYCHLLSNPRDQQGCYSTTPPAFNTFWIKRYFSITFFFATAFLIGFLILRKCTLITLRGLFYFISVIDVLLVYALYEANSDNFWWWVRGGGFGYPEPHWIVIGSLLLYVPLVSLLVSKFFFNNRQFFLVFTITNSLAIPLLVLSILLPYT